MRNIRACLIHYLTNIMACCVMQPISEVCALVLVSEIYVFYESVGPRSHRQETGR